MGTGLGWHDTVIAHMLGEIRVSLRSLRHLGCSGKAAQRSESFRCIRLALRGSEQMHRLACSRCGSHAQMLWLWYSAKNAHVEWNQTAPFPSLYSLVFNYYDLDVTQAKGFIFRLVQNCSGCGNQGSCSALTSELVAKLIFQTSDE